MTDDEWVDCFSRLLWVRLGGLWHVATDCRWVGAPWYAAKTACRTDGDVMVDDVALVGVDDMRAAKRRMCSACRRAAATFRQRVRDSGRRATKEETT